MDYFFYEKSLVILLNARTVVSLVGIVLVVIGNFAWNRKFDHAHNDSSGNDGYQAMSDGTRLPSRFNTIALMGWTLLAASYGLERSELLGFEKEPSMVLYLQLALIVAAGILQSFLIPKALIEGTMEELQVYYWPSYFVCLVGAGFLNLFLNEDTSSGMHASSLIGAVCVVVAPIFLYKARRRGEAMTSTAAEETGQNGPVTIPENRVYVFNLGGPILVSGWFLWWISMNAIHAMPDGFFLQLYGSDRAWIAFISSAIILLIKWMTGYALDATAPMNDKEDPVDMVKNAPAFGAGTLFFGDADEIPVAMTVAWGFFGFSAFWPYVFEWVPWVLQAIFLFVGYSMGMQEVVLREHNAAAFSRWARCVAIGILLCALLIGYYGRGMAVGLMLMGLLLTSIGSISLHTDRKIGVFWMQQSDAKVPSMTADRPQVYSYGVLAFPLGMIALAWGLSIHPY